MKSNVYLNRTFLFVLLAVYIFSEGFTSNKIKNVFQWQPWETSLMSENQRGSGPVGLEVIFTGPGGQTFRNPAFTDDGRLYRLRAAFPSAGIWRWKTRCSDPGDPGLNNKTGKVRVKPYTGENLLYKHGDLKISKNSRYLIYSDGTPFLWMGETGWFVERKSTMSEWHSYINARVAQHFSVVQISPRQIPRNQSEELPPRSFKEDGTVDPVFWQELEAKIQYANEQGLFILMVGVGKKWEDQFAKNSKNQDFETYLTGRFAALMVIFSPSFDELYNVGNDSVATRMHRLTTHLITQHPGTNYEANRMYRNALSVDFCGEQSGHHNGNLTEAYHAARAWTLDMWNGDPVKPVIDIEAMYDAYGNNNAKNWREKDVRKLGWIAWLSGSRGYTYGAGDVPPKVPGGSGGVWRFNEDSTKYDYWRKALRWPSAGQMPILHDFFSSIEWWRLVPSHELIQNQPGDDTLKMVASKSREGDMVLAYLPDNSDIVLDLKDFSGPLTGTWFSPVTGTYKSISKPVIPKSGILFSRPEGWEDSVLLLTKSKKFTILILKKELKILKR